MGVKDAALWKGPHMTALKLAAAESSKVIKQNKKQRVKRSVVVGVRRGRT